MRDTNGTQKSILTVCVAFILSPIKTIFHCYATDLQNSLVVFLYVFLAVLFMTTLLQI